MANRTQTPKSSRAKALSLSKLHEIIDITGKYANNPYTNEKESVTRITALLELSQDEKNAKKEISPAFEDKSGPHPAPKRRPPRSRDQLPRPDLSPSHSANIPDKALGTRHDPKLVSFWRNEAKAADISFKKYVEIHMPKPPN